MSGLSGARCVGQSWLFDSTDRGDHIEARKLCDECPAIHGCRALLREALEAPCVGAGAGPIGTWAGLLFGRVGQNKPRVDGAGHIGVIRGKVGAQVKSGPTPRARTHGTGPDPCPALPERRLTAS